MANSQIVMEGVRIIFRNFEGKEGQYNRLGDRNFAVLLDNETAEELTKDGWNVKWLKAKEEYNEPEQAYLQISVNFKGRPPRVVMINSRGRTDLDEDTVDTLDWIDIANVDLIVRPYEWSVNGKSGIKAYLKSLFVTVDEDELEIKYSNVPDAIHEQEE